MWSPPWTRAPLLAFRRPAVIVAVVGAAAVVACAGSSASLFLSSAASASLRVQLAAQCPDAAFPVLEQSGFGPGAAPQPNRDVEARRAISDAGLPEPFRVVQVEGSVGLNAGSQSTLGHVFYRSEAVDNVEVLSRSRGEGLVLPQQTADYLGVATGGLVQVGEQSLPVVGTYRELFSEPTVRPYWCSYTSLFLNLSSGAAPPALVLATSPEVAEQVGQAGGQSGMIRAWVAPIRTTGLTFDVATAVVQRRDRAFAAAGIRNAFGGAGHTGLLPDMVHRTGLVIDGLRGPVVPIAAGGGLLALLLMAAAGSFWADRRESELRLLSSRGIGPGPLAVKAGLELGLAAAAGTALGWYLARWLVAAIGPSPYLDADAPRQAALTAAAGLLAGLAMLMVAAAARARGVTERPLGVRRGWSARLPWELLLLAAAAASWLRLRGGDAVVLRENVAQVSFLLVSFPLLFLAGAALLAVRLFSVLLPRLRRAASRSGPALYLAVTRVAGATLVSAGLLATVALPIGMLVYSATLTDTTQTTLEAKARVVVGSDTAVISVDRATRTPAIDAVGTIVVRYPNATLNGDTVTVLAIDPATFSAWAYWNNSFAEQTLPQLLDELGADPAGTVRTVAVGVPEGPATVRLGKRDVPVRVVATAETFPGRRQPEPLLVVNATALGEIDTTAGRWTEVWSTRSAERVIAALDSNTRVSRVQDRDTVFNVANFQSVAWTFGYLQALAAFIGLIAVGGLLLYLETRQRSRVASYALARRMGLTAPAHLWSLIYELQALLAVAFLLGATLGAGAVLTVYSRLDIDPNRPPPPLLDPPTITIGVAVAATAVVALLAAGYAQRAATRADMAEVLRLNP